MLGRKFTSLASFVSRATRKRVRQIVRRPLGIEALESRLVPTAYTWSQTAAGTFAWNDAANWGGAGFPNAAGDVANVTSALAGNETINLTVPITVGSLTVGSSAAAGAFTIAAGGGTLTFQDPSGAASLTESADGGDTINAPITVASNLTVNTIAAAPLTVIGGIANGTNSLTVAGTGTLVYNGTASGSGPVTVNAGAELAGTGSVAQAAAPLIATSYFDSAVYEFDSSTGAIKATLVAPYTSSLLSGPSGATIGPDGNLYISSQSNNAILEYNFSTQALTTFIPSTTLQPIATANTDTNFAPAGLRFDSTGNLYVSLNGGQSASSGGAVVRFSTAMVGGELTYGGTATTIATGLIQPTGLAFGTAAGDTNNLYVSSTAIVMVGGSPTGEGEVSKITNAPAVATASTPTVFVQPGSGGLNSAAGLAWGPGGLLYVVDLGATSFQGNVLAYNPDGSFDKILTPTGTGQAGNLLNQFPSDIAFDTAGHFLTANLGPSYPPALAGSINQYNDDGTFDQAIVQSSQFPSTGTSGQSGVSPSQLALLSAPSLTVNGTLTPGGATTPGALAAGDVNFAATGTFAVTIKGTTAGTGYSQLTSTGTVNLNGAALTGTVSGTVTPGSQYDIISSKNAVVGTFNGAAEGSTMTLDGQPFSITYVGGTSDHDVVLTALSAPAITSANAATFFTGGPNTFTVTATGSPASTFTETGALPAGVTLSSAGVLSGTPTATGAFPITITASNGVGTPATQSFTLTVNAGVAPAITSTNTATFQTGTVGVFTVTATGSPTPTFTETGALPAGVTLSSAGVLSGNTTTAGTFPITITASNGVTPDATQTFTLTVGTAPTITSADAATFATGTTNTFTATATGSPTPTFTETGTLPAGVTFSNGVLSGTPTAAGTFPITITATNGIGTDATQSFTLTVGTAPTITSADNTGFGTGTAGTFTVTATGTPAPTFTETGALPAGVTFTSAGVLSGTPTAAGTFPITITATNGIGTDATQSFTLTVGTPPAITSASSTTFATGTAGTFTVTATGTPAPTFTETGALPAGVTFTSAGVLSGTPTVAGSFPITVTATNGAGPDATQSFTLTVGTAPTITSANAVSFTFGATSAFSVTATGSPTPTITETGTLPGGVTFSNGVLSGTPTATGSFPITLSASNGIGTPATQTFTLTVNGNGLETNLVVSGLTDGTATLYQTNASGQYASSTVLNPFADLGVVVRTATADVNGDGIPDTIFVTGPGTPVRFAIVSGADNHTLLVGPTAPFGGSEDFTGGAFVAAGDIEDDGRADFVFTPDEGGGARVTVFALTPTGLSTRADFFGIADPNFRGGARVAVGDVNGDGTPDIVVAAGFGGGPRVAIFDGKSITSGTPTRLVPDFFAFPGADATNLRNGVYVAAGDVNGDGSADLIFGGGDGGAPHVLVLDGRTLVTDGVTQAETDPLANFFVNSDTTSRGGIRVAAKATVGSEDASVVVGSGAGLTSQVRVYPGSTLTPSGEPPVSQTLDPFGETLADGVYVG
ncbi:beta strand repeat-containing protein [Fimbriiglobus ruber]|uniref:Fibronectin type III domain protein n=1 Tax=Fimbriiglobus ruber TaxID=1908690 RepID=A0A225D8G6_9BACT|nr:putative Ig domain-containing protein [Fimbriiglobus ruber]OWK37752.1 Fibronectin type III domain protein [Fimbriiglobus ruber]